MLEEGLLGGVGGELEGALVVGGPVTACAAARLPFFIEPRLGRPTMLAQTSD